MRLPPPEDPLNPQAQAKEKALEHLRTAYFLRRRKDPWGAIAEAQKSAEADPSFADPFDYMAEIFLELQLLDRALEALYQAQQRDPSNSDRLKRIEQLQADYELFSTPLKELLQEQPPSWRRLFKAIFLRPDPLWYRRGSFYSALAMGSLLLLGGLGYLLFSLGRIAVLLIFIHLLITGWVFYDARIQGEAPYFWLFVSLIFPLFGAILYLVVRGMISGYGVDQDTRYFRG